MHKKFPCWQFGQRSKAGLVKLGMGSWDMLDVRCSVGQPRKFRKSILFLNSLIGKNYQGTILRKK